MVAYDVQQITFEDMTKDQLIQCIKRLQDDIAGYKQQITHLDTNLRCAALQGALQLHKESAYSNSAVELVEEAEVVLTFLQGTQLQGTQKG